MLEDTLAKRVKQAAERAFNTNERLNHKSLWEELSEFIIPSQSGIFNGETTRGDKKTKRLFDSTAIQANHDLAASIHSTLTNPSTKWSSIRFKEDDLNNNPEAISWLEAVNNKIHETLNESNFDGMSAKNYQAITALGSMVLFHEEDPQNKEPGFGGFRFNAWHLSEVAWFENEAGIVDTVYRRFKWPLKKIIERFPDAKLPDDMVRNVEKNLDKEFLIYLEIKPRPADQVKFNEVGLALPKERPFSSTYVLDKGGVTLEESGYYELPVYVARWSTMPGEVYGRGSGYIALPDIRSVNKAKHLGFKATARAIDPPMLAEKRNVLGNFDIRPGRLTMVRDVNGIKELNSQARFDVTQFAVQELRDSIKSIFFIDKLMLPPRTETGEQTAFEVAERLAQMQKVLGPTLSRFNNEYLTPLIVRSFKLLLRGGALPPLPEVLVSRGINIDIRFVNPLSRNQRFEEVNNLSSWVAETAQYAQMTGDPSVLDHINGDFITREKAEIRGIPAGAIRSADEIAKIREARQQAAEQQQQLEAGVKVADIAAKTGGLNE